MYQTKLEQFEGPLDLLLELIEGQKLDITSVSLSNVTDQFLEYVSGTTDLHPEELADFLVVAAKLLLIKSRILLPSLIPEEEEVDLEKQLRIYKEYYEASKKINAMILDKRYSFARSSVVAVAFEQKTFRPPEGVTADHLNNFFRVILKRLEPFITIPEEVILRTITLRTKIENIRAQLELQSRMNFKSLLEQAQNRTEIIVTFLALLELVKQRSIAVVQDNMFADIAILRRNEQPESQTE